MTEDKYFENIKTYRLLAKKEVGQNFLIDAGKAKAIVDLLEAKEGERVLEIGCGAGSLTYFLSLSEAKVDAIDIDEAMVAKLQEDFKGVGNLEIKQGNAMDFDYGPYDKIIGNLPYYITSGIIEEVLLKAEKATLFVFMVQKEAYQRLSAPTGSKDYSPLNILLSYLTNLKRCFVVGPSAFVPPPRVESLVFIAKKKNPVDQKEAKRLYKLCKGVFINRRKTIFNNLKNYLGDANKASDALVKAGINPQDRPENITPEGYLKLLKSL